MIHSYTADLKIWKTRILKSIGTWFEMGQQIAQAKEVYWPSQILSYFS